MDEGTKRNLVRNLENKLKKLTTEEKNKDILEEHLWCQLGRNGYRKKEEGKKNEVKRKEEGGK